MNAPNQFSHSDLLAARELVKARNNPAHWTSIDNGDWDAWGEIERAMAEVIRARKEEEVGE